MAWFARLGRTIPGPPKVVILSSCSKYRISCLDKSLSSWKSDGEHGNLRESAHGPQRIRISKNRSSITEIRPRISDTTPALWLRNRSEIYHLNFEHEKLGTTPAKWIQKHPKIEYCFAKIQELLRPHLVFSRFYLKRSETPIVPDRTFPT